MKQVEYEILVHRIVDAEMRAQEMVHAQEERLATLDTNLKEESKQLSEQYLARAKERIKRLEQDERAYADGEIKRIEQELASDLAATQARFDAKSEEYCAFLLRQVIGEPS